MSHRQSLIDNDPGCDVEFAGQILQGFPGKNPYLPTSHSRHTSEVSSSCDPIEQLEQEAPQYPLACSAFEASKRVPSENPEDHVCLTPPPQVQHFCKALFMDILADSIGSMYQVWAHFATSYVSHPFPYASDQPATSKHTPGLLGTDAHLAQQVLELTLPVSSYGQAKHGSHLCFLKLQNVPTGQSMPPLADEQVKDTPRSDNASSAVVES